MSKRWVVSPDGLSILDKSRTDTDAVLSASGYFGSLEALSDYVFEVAAKLNLAEPECPKEIAAEIASYLDGREHPLTIEKSVIEMAKDNGLVIAYDGPFLTELAGAITAEVVFWDGVSALIDDQGVVEFDVENVKISDPEDREWLRLLLNRELTATKIEALSEYDGFCRYEIGVPATSFIVHMEDTGKPFYKGLVFSVSDLGKGAQ